MIVEYDGIGNSDIYELHNCTSLSSRNRDRFILCWNLKTFLQMLSEHILSRVVLDGQRDERAGRLHPRPQRGDQGAARGIEKVTILIHPNWMAYSYQGFGLLYPRISDSVNGSVYCIRAVKGGTWRVTHRKN